MKNVSLKQFAKLTAALAAERATLLARLQEIEAALGTGTSSTAPKVASDTLDKITAEYLEQHLPKLAAAKSTGKRKMSAAGRAAIAAAAKARWAKVKAASQ